jgi:hypothetical protein
MGCHLTKYANTARLNESLVEPNLLLLPFGIHVPYVNRALVRARGFRCARDATVLGKAIVAFEVKGHLEDGVRKPNYN